jgi:hypothetical protein
MAAERREPGKCGRHYRNLNRSHTLSDDWKFNEKNKNAKKNAEIVEKIFANVWECVQRQGQHDLFTKHMLRAGQHEPNSVHFTISNAPCCQPHVRYQLNENIRKRFTKFSSIERKMFEITHEIGWLHCQRLSVGFNNSLVRFAFRIIALDSDRNLFTQPQRLIGRSDIVAMVLSGEWW